MKYCKIIRLLKVVFLFHVYSPTSALGGEMGRVFGTADLTESGAPGLEGLESLGSAQVGP